MILKIIYERILKNILIIKDVELLFEIDGDIRNFEVFLFLRILVFVVWDVKVFLLCIVNLDFKLWEIIVDVCVVRE